MKTNRHRERSAAISQNWYQSFKRLLRHYIPRNDILLSTSFLVFNL